MLEGSGVAKLDGKDWIVLNDLPEPKPIVTGQGEYQKGFDPLEKQEVDPRYFELLEKLQKIVAAAGDAIMTLVEMAKKDPPRRHEGETRS